MTSRPLTFDNAKTLGNRCRELLLARCLPLAYPEHLTLERLQHLFFASAEDDELHRRFVEKFSAQHMASSTTHLNWKAELSPKAEVRFTISVTKSKLRYPPGDVVRRYRVRDPQAFDDFKAWLESHKVKFVEAMTGDLVISKVIGETIDMHRGREWAETAPRILKTTAQLRDTWPMLLEVDRSGRADDLNRKRTQRSVRELPAKLEHWIPAVDQWLIEGSLVYQKNQIDLTSGFSIPDGIISLQYSENREKLKKLYGQLGAI